MLNIGIIGNKNIEFYTRALSDLPFFQLKAVFDPSFQIENNISPFKSLTVYTISELFNKCDAIAFSSDNRLYFNLIKQCLKNGKAIFLHGSNNLNIEEHILLNKLVDESKEIMQIFHPYVFSEQFSQLFLDANKPILYNIINSGVRENNLMHVLRSDLSALLSVIKSPVKHTSMQSHAVMNDFPDTYSVNISFDNGASASFITEAIDSDRKHELRAYSYNGLKKADLYNELPKLERNIQKQLTVFYNNVLCASIPIFSIENELKTQYIIEKVKEKVRFAFNIL